MAYDEQLASRIRRAFGRSDGVHRTKDVWRSGVSREGRMCCGIVGSDLMVRVPLDEFDAALRKRHVRPVDFTGKPLKGFIYVLPLGIRNAVLLRGWPTLGERAARSATTEDRKRRSNAKKR